MGNVDDMEYFWDAPDDINPEYSVMNTKRLQSEKCNEGTIFRSYLKKINAPLDYTVKDHWNILKNYFICLDNGIVNLHYAKDDSSHLYTKSVNNMQSEFAFDDNDFILKTETFGFVNWFNLYNGLLKYDEVLEKYADAPLF